MILKNLILVIEKSALPGRQTTEKESSEIHPATVSTMGSA